MTRFSFDLLPVGDIVPWGDAGDQSLSWFALTHGEFRREMGEQTLFRSSEAILA